MPTTKLTLPLIDGSNTADVVRDMNALANAVDDKAGASDGLATLDATGKVPASQLPETIGNATKLNGKAVIYTNLQDNDTLRYDAQLDKWRNVAQNIDRIAPGNVSNASVTVGNGQLTLKWTDPTDSDWASTKLVRKVGGYPTSANDGTVVVTSTVRNQYQTTGFVDTGLTNGTTYFYQLFPVDASGNVNSNTANRLAATPVAYQEYGVAWNKTTGQVTRLGSTVGLSAGAGFNSKLPWQGVRRCNLADNGTVNAYHGDPTYKDDGANGQVMVEIPKFWFKKTTTANGYEFWISDGALSGYSVHPAFYRDRGTGTAVEVDKRYAGAYLGFINGSKLESKSGVTPSASQTIGTFRTRAEARGSGWGIEDFNLFYALQMLYLVEYASMDSQTALGQGYTGASAVRTTGGTAASGSASSGSASATVQVSYRGVEDIWGNLYYWIDGLYSNGSWQLLIGNRAFNDTGSGYSKTITSGVASNSGGYMSDIVADQDAGFIGKTFSGSSTTGLYDYGSLYAGYLPIASGGWSAGAYAGVFRLNVNYSASYSHSDIGARLAY
ncbi:fibronectin type III domain-containing protein [Exiguobacterium sp. MMG028]|uniref:fibronectin type III domain-containing protein n=1 Tax=Exiguobacterium sp. MMG028 TaxID=3021979 RepID=UPI0022FDF8B0|nr:fibronectin type III domain-containing protein [Exiguobacterium sp. MMG028]MDA5561942.1 fibronectin type III domain-containing protein [Exiguobacterium sp. MMG028]